MSTALVDPLRPSAYQPPAAHASPRRRWQVWRSPEDQPAWARPALLGIAGLAALLYAWNITQAGLAPFYSVAVKSMSVSWKAFFYGALDPKATITIDKLAGSFLPQALSARVFGFHPWSLALPQVIEGVIAVLVMYRVVRRWAGVVPGLLAAGIFALTPITASMFGHSMEDGALTMCLVLAADAYQRAVMEARLRSLIWAGVWVGLGFQTKMLQAWMVLPALAIGYLVAAPARLGRRLGQLAVAGVVMLAVSLSWIALYTFTPAADRPYVDGSTDNSAVAMVFGYNGLERFGITVPGAVDSGPGVTSGRGAPGGAGGGFPPDREFRDGGARGGFPSGRDFPDGGARGGGLPGATAAGNPGAGRPAGAGTGTGGARLAAAGGGFGGSFGTGWTKLLGSSYGPEVGWLYPLAVLGLVFGLAWTRRGRRTDQVRAGFVMWGVWLLTFGLIFSDMSTIPHTAYVASLAPPVAALAAAGIVMFWRTYRAGGWRGWILPAAVAIELAWAVFLWRSYPGFLPWARTAAVAVGAAAVVVLVAAKLARRTGTRLLTAGLAAGVAAMLAAPATWAASVLDVSYAGSSFNAGAGPAGGMFGGGAGVQPSAAVAEQYGFHVRNAAGGLTATATTTLTSAERQIYDYVSAHRDGAGYLMAVSSWTEASPYILATGQEIMPMGGFSGTVPEPTLAHVKELVGSGQLRFFLLGGTGLGGFGLRGGATTAQAVTSWVESSCSEVPASDYGGTSPGAAASSTGTGFGAGFGAAAEALYECGGGSR